MTLTWLATASSNAPKCWRLDLTGGNPYLRQAFTGQIAREAPLRHQGMPVLATQHLGTSAGEGRLLLTYRTIAYSSTSVASP